MPPSFSSDSAPDQLAPAACPLWGSVGLGSGCGWVEHSTVWFRTCRCHAGGQARALLGPEETPAWCFLVDHSRPGRPNAALVVRPRVGGVVVVAVVGVWLCVECCIVDASILLW